MPSGRQWPAAPPARNSSAANASPSMMIVFYVLRACANSAVSPYSGAVASPKSFEWGSCYSACWPHGSSSTCLAMRCSPSLIPFTKENSGGLAGSTTHEAETSFKQSAHRAARRSRAPLAPLSRDRSRNLLPWRASFRSWTPFLLGGHEPQPIRATNPGGRLTRAGALVCVDENVSGHLCAAAPRLGFESAGSFCHLAALSSNFRYAKRAPTCWLIPVALGAAGLLAFRMDLRLLSEYHRSG